MPAGSATDALRLLRRERPNAALLDWVLLDGGAARLADRLAAEGVPFAVVTALEPDRLDRPLLRGRPLRRRPYSVPALRATVRQLLRLDLTRALALTEGHVGQARASVERQAGPGGGAGPKPRARRAGTARHTGADAWTARTSRRCRRSPGRWSAA